MVDSLRHGAFKDILTTETKIFGVETLHFLKKLHLIPLNFKLNRCSIKNIPNI